MMAEIQKVQLQGQSIEPVKRTKDSPQADFSEMLKEKSQSVSGQKNTEEEVAQAANQNKTQESGTEQEPMAGSAKEQETVPDGAGISGSAEEESGEAAGLPVELTGEELAQLAGMVASVSRNETVAAVPDAGAPAEEAVEAVETVDGISGVSQSAEGVLVDAEQLAAAAAGDPEPTEELQAQTDGDQELTIPLPEQEAAEEAPQEILEQPAAGPETDDTKDQDQERAGDLSRESEGFEPSVSSARSAESTAAEGVAAEGMAAEQAVQRPAEAIRQEPAAGSTEVLKTTPETLPDDVGETIASKLAGQQSGTTLELTLEPASLGKIIIRLVYEDGKASFTLMSDNPKTLETLSQRAGEIAQILEQKTGQTTIVYVPEEPYPDQDKGQQQGGGERRQEQQKQPGQDQTETFAQQLRLGLI